MVLIKCILHSNLLRTNNNYISDQPRNTTLTFVKLRQGRISIKGTNKSTTKIGENKISLIKQTLVIAASVSLCIICIMSPVGAFNSLSCDSKESGSGLGSVHAGCTVDPVPQVELRASAGGWGWYVADGWLRNEFTAPSSGKYRITVKGFAIGELQETAPSGTPITIEEKASIDVYASVRDKGSSLPVYGGDEFGVFNKKQDDFGGQKYSENFKHDFDVELEKNTPYIIELRAQANAKSKGASAARSWWGGDPNSHPPVPSNGYCIKWLECTVTPQIECHPTLEEVTQLINRWAQNDPKDKVPLSDVIDAINKWANCDNAQGTSSGDKEQQKAQLMAMLQPNENSNQVPQCQAGYHQENGNCVPDQVQCQAGYHQENGNCVPDQVQCQAGYHQENGNCVPDQVQCQAGYHLENGNCVPDQVQCQAGYHQENGNCVPDQVQCQAGYHQENGNCVPDQVQCQAGYHLENGNCIPDQVQCQAGYHLENSNCVPDQVQIECHPTLEEVTQLINRWAQDGSSVPLADVIDAINKWSNCDNAQGVSPEAKKQQKAKLMAMLQNPTNQVSQDQGQYNQGQYGQGSQDQGSPDQGGQYNQVPQAQGPFPY